MEGSDYILSVISPTNGKRVRPYVLLILGAAMIAQYLLKLVPAGFSEYIAVFGVLFVVTAAISAYYVIERTAKAKKCLARLAEKAELKRAAAELSAAVEENEKHFEKKTVFLTEHYVISPGMGVAVNYRDLTDLNCVAANYRASMSYVDGISLKTDFGGWMGIISQKTPSKQLIPICMAIEEKNPELKKKALEFNK